MTSPQRDRIFHTLNSRERKSHALCQHPNYAGSHPSAKGTHCPRCHGFPVRELGKQPEHIHIVIQEIEEEDWGFAGLLTDDWKKQIDQPKDIE